MPAKDIKSTISDVEKSVGSITEDIETVSKDIDKIKKNVNATASVAEDIYKNLKLDKIVTAVNKVHAEVLATGKDIQRYTGASISQWQTAYTQISKAAREMNTAIKNSVFNSSDFLKSAQLLASIGWSDMKTLSQVTPAFTALAKATGTMSESFAKSVTEMQKVFKDGTDRLIKGLSDSLVAYSEVFGVTARELQVASEVMNSNITRLSKGSTEAYNNMTKSLYSAVSLSAQMGVDSAKMTNLLVNVMNASGAELASYAQSFGISGSNVTEARSQLNEGQFLEVTRTLLSSIGSVMSSGDYQQINELMALMSSFGFSKQELLMIGNNLSNMEKYLSEIDKASARQGATDEKLSESMLTIKESVSNWFSNSGFVNALSNLFTTIGIDSLNDLASAGIAIAQLVQLQTINAKLSASELFSGGSSGIFKALSGLVSGKSEGGIGGFSVLGEGLKKVFGLLKTAGPHLLIIFGVVELVSAMLRNSGILKSLETLRDSIKGLVSVFAYLFNQVSSLFDTLVTALEPAVTSILDLVSTLINTLTPALTVLIDVAMSVLKPIMNILTGILQPITYLIQQILTPLIDILQTGLDFALPISEMFTEVLGGVFDIFADINKIFAGLGIDTVFAPLTFVFSKLKSFMDWLSPIIKKVGNGIRTAIGGIQTFFGWISNAFTSIGNWLADLSIFGWHPFASLRGPEVSTVDDSTAQEAFNKLESSKAAGGLTYGFGMTSEGIHLGTDIPMSSGTPIRASDIGVVTGSGYNGTYGNYISMLDSGGVDNIYAHLSERNANVGDLLLPGQLLGTSGSTGNSEIPHLHYETRRGDTIVNPTTIRNSRSNNADVVRAIEIMTQRLEKKLEEVSEETYRNTDWINEFDRRNRNRNFNEA